jgi:rRNA maturation RNase YbeY
MTDLVIRNRHPRGGVDLWLLREITRAALVELTGGDSPNASHELAIILVNDRRMAALNEAHLAHPGPTDVITFDYADPAGGGPKRLHGDVFIGLDVARRQAKEFGTSWPEELVRYVVHGLLHLQGHDDLAPGPRRRMKRVENRIVRCLAARFAFSRLARPARLRA